MLSNALNFLSDKRRRFHRSDTMPAFKSVMCPGTGSVSMTDNTQRDTTGETVNHAKQQPEEKQQKQSDEPQPFGQSQQPLVTDSVEKEISETVKSPTYSSKVNPTGTAEPQRQLFCVTPDQRNIADLARTTSTTAATTTSAMVTSDSVKTNRKGNRLTMENFAQSECDLTRPNIGGKGIVNELHLGSPSKLETLSLPLQSHLPSDSLGTDHLGGFYSLSPSPLSYGSSGSPNLHKEEDQRNAYNESNTSVRFQEKPQQNTQKIHFLCDDKRDLPSVSPTMTTNGSAELTTQSNSGRNTMSENKIASENKDFTNYVSSARNRVAQIRAKAGAKTKLQRSNSSAQVLRRSREAVSSTRDRVRATSTQREVTIPASSTADSNHSHQREQSMDQKRRGRRRGKTWVDKGPRSRSVTSPFHKERSPCEYEPSTNKMDMLVELARRATVEQFWKICMSPTDGMELVQPNWPNASSQFLNLPQKTNTAGALTDPSIGMNSMHAGPSRRNRYTMVRRLRRNNSSINWSVDRPFPKVEDELNVPTSQTAGDLLLPSKDVIMERSKRAEEHETQQLLNDLFLWIEHRDIDQIIENYQKLAYLSEELSSSSGQNDRYGVGLNPLDYAFLVSSPQIIAFLIMLGFRPGALLSVTLEYGPSETRVSDPMKFFLTRRIGDAEAALNTAQVSLDTAIARANSCTIALRNLTLTEMNQSATDDAYSEVTLREMELQKASKIRDRLIELCTALDQYSPVPAAPKKVVLMVCSAQSLLIRVSPPRLPRVTPNDLRNATDSGGKDEISDTTSSCESSSVESTPHIMLEGRRMAQFDADNHESLVIRYRVEWSLTADFQEVAGSSTVMPAIRLSSIMPDLNNHKLSLGSYIRTGFYELEGLKPGQMVYVRVFSFTVRGWSEPCYAEPRCLAPSTWTEALPKVREQSEKPECKMPLRYGANMYTEKFQLLKKLLDQQLLLWAYQQQSTGTTGENSTVVDDSGKRNRSPMIQRKRSFRFPFTTKGMKFVKQTKSGIYLALVCHHKMSRSPSNPDREALGKPHLILVDDFIPMVCVTKDEPNPGSQLSADVNWFARLLAQPKLGTDLQLISDNLLRQITPANLQFRFLLLTALQRMQVALGSYDVGVLYPDGFSGRILDSGVSSCSNDPSAEFVFPPNFPGGVKVIDDLVDSAGGSFVSSMLTAQSETSTKIHQKALILVLVKLVENSSDVTCSAGLRWCPLEKFLRQNKMNLADFNLAGQAELVQSPKISFVDSDSGTNRSFSVRSDQVYLTPEMHLLNNLDVLLYYSERRRHKLDPGLYVSLIQMHAQFDHQAKILAIKTAHVIHMLPVERVRRRTHVCRSEWSTLYSLLVAADPENTGSGLISSRRVENEPYALRFCQKLHKAWLRLAKRLSYTEEELAEFRFYLPEVIRISPDHALILIFPRTDQVCLPPAQFSTPPPNNCSWIFMTYFERNLGAVYDPEFYNTAASLLSILEVLIPMSTLMQRQCITDSELSHSTERTNTLQSIYHQVDSAYQEKRWLSETISAARDRKRPLAFTLLSKTLKLFVQSITRHTGSGKYGLRVVGDLDQIRLRRSDWNDVLYLGSQNALKETVQLVQQRNNTKDIQNLLRVCHVSENIDLSGTDAPPEMCLAANHDRQISVVRVFTGYVTELGSGISVKILISIRATARDIVEAVVTKLNRALEAKWHKSTPKTGCICVGQAANKDQFCLTVSLGPVERVVPNDFRPLLLQEPWRSGKLYVRLIDEVQQYSSSHSPPRLYFATENHSASKLSENAEMVNYLLNPIRSDRALFGVIPSVYHWAKKTNPPKVYMDGKPVIIV